MPQGWDWWLETIMGFGKDGKGVIIAEQRSAAIGTLANKTGVLIGTKLVTLERFRMLKAEIHFNVSEVTGDEATGLTLYLVDGDLSLAEAELAIEENGPLGPNDNIAAERAMRPVFRVPAVPVMAGADPIASGAVNNASFIAVLNPRWTFAASGKAWNWMVYNNGTALTTGSTVRFTNKLFGVWVT